ncbi:hypothetical protein GYMLUDRAFT_263753 [Collybiopsis luxurians FD-317 M1]|uniref:G domain-containing protein n=1 Tax=Collybiopsis luxurians FD-317 M1 TaxID=944289 RepID=A0A0D0C1Q9_9AGAR|nr:hypothetical protein GYMLUDRAFT_263753 [Collybiopsis luxurians FD-317 M1]
MSIHSNTPLFTPPSPGLSSRTVSNGNSTIIEQELVSSTEEILAACPKFRILVLGKSGAGKSSLINATFNVDQANVSHEQSGVSDIYEEITSEQNSRFILHDSQGFAAGETQNFETVKKFLDDRARQPELKDRLHAIWFCVEVPTENGALFETADQKFLQLNLHNVPVVVVFTKFDLLVRKLEKEAVEDVDDERLEELVRQKAEGIFERTCVRPLMAITTNHSYVKVSNSERYRNTLIHLVDETRNRLDDRMWILWALAQRASVDEKIDACIAVGKRKYWRGLAASLHFPGRNLKECLHRIHDDIIDVWNFSDPKAFLKSHEFKVLMSHMVKDLDDRGPIQRRSGVIASATGTIGAVTSIIPGAVVFAIPAAVGVAVAQWLFFAYQEAPAILQLMMGYICDLTTLLQCLFWVMRVHGEAIELEEDFIALAFDALKETGAQKLIHQKIRVFIDDTATFKLHQKDVALDELIKIIRNVRFKPEEVGNSRRRTLSMISQYSLPL